MGLFAVIDTETNWADHVMSIGCCLAQEDTFRPVEMKYFVLTPEYLVGGMFSGTLFTACTLQPVVCSREEALQQLRHWFRQNGIRKLFAYNAAFDRNHLPELKDYPWHDIMRLAAYRQFNPAISAADCFSTGRMKRGYGVEPMLRILSGRRGYHETHNAVTDALDELEIMRLLSHPLERYIPL